MDYSVIWAVCSVVSDSVALQAPLSRGFPSEEYWGGLPFPSPGHLPDPVIESMSPELAGRFFFFFNH